MHERTITSNNSMCCNHPQAQPSPPGHLPDIMSIHYLMTCRNRISTYSAHIHEYRDTQTLAWTCTKVYNDYLLTDKTGWSHTVFTRSSGYRFSLAAVISTGLQSAERCTDQINTGLTLTSFPCVNAMETAAYKPSAGRTPGKINTVLPHEKFTSPVMLVRDSAAICWGFF